MKKMLSLSSRILPVKTSDKYQGEIRLSLFNGIIMDHEQLELIQERLNRIESFLGIKTDIEKLKNFPPVYFISIPEAANRRRDLFKLFARNKITNITPYIYDRYRDEDHKIGGATSYLAPPNTRGPVTSHIKAIKEWYCNTSEPYAVFFEDDVSFEAVKYWNFTFEEFVDALPETWEVVQLALIIANNAINHTNYMNRALGSNKIRSRDWCDWSCAAYLIKREHAKKIIDNYYPDDTILLEYKGYDAPQRTLEWQKKPTSETMVYSYFTENVDTVFAFPLFTENLSYESTWTTEDYVDTNSPHNLSNKMVMDWWKTQGKNLTLEDIRYK